VGGGCPAEREVSVLGSSEAGGGRRRGLYQVECDCLWRYIYLHTKKPKKKDVQYDFDFKS